MEGEKPNFIAAYAGSCDPLQKGTYGHDVAADPTAGVYYICNPNNPSGTITKREDIAWLLANKNKDLIVLLD